MFWLRNEKVIFLVTHENSDSEFHRFRETKFLGLKLQIFSYPSVLTYVLGVQKNRLIETVLLSTHNIYFG